MDAIQSRARLMGARALAPHGGRETAGPWPWAHDWPGPGWTASLIERLPLDLRVGAFAAWKDAGTRLTRTPAGRGERTAIVHSFNQRLQSFDVDIDADEWSYSNLKREFAAYWYRVGLDEGDRWALKHGVTGTTRETRCGRALDRAYWRRRWRQRQGRMIEHAYACYAPTCIRWCSETAQRQARARMLKTLEWAQQFELVPSDGSAAIPMQDLLLGNRDARLYAELLARAKGIGTLASDAGYTTALLVTLTVPGPMHPTTSANGQRCRNRNYDGTTVKQAHDWLELRWQRFRASAFRRGRSPYWVLAEQPHLDGTPHLHLIVYIRPKDRAGIERLLRSAFDAKVTEGDARARHGLDIRDIEGASAVRWRTSAVSWPMWHAQWVRSPGRVIAAMRSLQTVLPSGVRMLTPRKRSGPASGPACMASAGFGLRTRTRRCGSCADAMISHCQKGLGRRRRTRHARATTRPFTRRWAMRVCGWPIKAAALVTESPAENFRGLQTLRG